jgi:hypothetical protein
MRRETSPRVDNPVVVAETYLHVGNSGVTFSVEDEGFGPTVKIRTSAFGNLNHETKLLVSKEGLKAVKDVIERALQYGEFSSDYVHRAMTESEMDNDKCTFGTGESHEDSKEPNPKALIRWQDDGGRPGPGE